MDHDPHARAGPRLPGGAHGGHAPAPHARVRRPGHFDQGAQDHRRTALQRRRRGRPARPAPDARRVLDGAVAAERRGAVELRDGEVAAAARHGGPAVPAQRPRRRHVRGPHVRLRRGVLGAARAGGPHPSFPGTPRCRCCRSACAVPCSVLVVAVLQILLFFTAKGGGGRTIGMWPRVVAFFSPFFLWSSPMITISQKARK